MSLHDIILSQLDGGIVDMPVKILTFSRMFTKSRAATLRNRRRKSACSSCDAVGTAKPYIMVRTPIAQAQQARFDGLFAFL